MLLPTTAAGRAVEDATRVGKAATRGSYNSLLRIGFNAVCKVLAAFTTFVCPDFSLIAHGHRNPSQRLPFFRCQPGFKDLRVLAISLIG